MGTNYYINQEKCSHCGHEPKRIHLGKSSFGWQFSFQYNGGKYYKNVDEMTVWLRDKTIIDEYGQEITQDDFWKMVQSKQGEKLSHAKEHPSDVDFVIDGFSFSDCEFS